MSFPTKLKQSRILKGYNIRETAELIEVSPSTYSRYESGKSQPNVDILKRIMQVLDADANYLLKDDTELVYVIEE